MMTSVEKQEKLDALESALYEGALKIKYADKEIEYRSTKEMKQLVSDLKKQLSLVPKKKRVYAEFGSGL